MNFLKNRDDQIIQINTFIIGVFIFFFLIKFLYWLPLDIKGKGFDKWVYTDWLIDYSSGFIRRGFSGEFLNLLSAVTNPKVIIGMLSWTIFIFVTAGYIRLLVKSLKVLSPVLFVALLFLPSLLPFYLYDHGAFGRKEIIGYIILLWHLHILENMYNSENKTSIIKHYIIKLLPITIILLPIHIFIHESSFLLFVPIHVIISYSVLKLIPFVSFNKKILFLFLIYLPTLLAFLTIVIFSQNNIEVALAISKKWEHAHVLEPGSFNISEIDTIETSSNSITALSWSISRAASMSLSLPITMVLAWLLLCTILGFSTVYIGRMVNNFLITNLTKKKLVMISRKQYSKNLYLKYFILPLAISSPLYILGCDIGRWFAVSCINYIMITLSREVNFVEIELYKANEKKAENVKGEVINNIGIFRNYVEIFLLLFILFFIRLPHWCKYWNAMLAEPFKSLFQRILNLF